MIRPFTPMSTLLEAGEPINAGRVYDGHQHKLSPLSG